MTHDEAVELIAVLASYFRQEVSDETAVLWSRELVPFDLQDGLEAAEIFGKAQKFMPDLATLLAYIRDIRNTRLLAETPSLMSGPDCCEGQTFGHFYRDHAPDHRGEDWRPRVDALLQMPKRYRADRVAIREAFARMVGGRS